LAEHVLVNLVREVAHDVGKEEADADQLTTPTDEGRNT
jgi:hypothetical protein